MEQHKNDPRIGHYMLSTYNVMFKSAVLYMWIE